MPSSTLQLRCIVIPRSPLIELFERELGRALTHEYRHFLAGEPVNCGTVLQRFQDGEWVTGRYEWSCNREDLPTWHVDGRTTCLAPSDLLRWPVD